MRIFRSTSGFSLAEICLALGILSILLLPIIGLLNVGLRSGKNAQIDTALAVISRSALAHLRTNNMLTYTGETRWYDFEGNQNPSDVGAYFECVISKTTPPPLIPQNRMATIRMEFRYPIEAPVARRITNSFSASFAPFP